MPFTLELGSAAPDFKLPGTDGRTYSLADFQKAKLLIVVFACNHCPYVVGSEARMKKLVADYAPRGVQMVAINANETQNHPNDSFAHMQERVRQEKLTWTYLRDETQDIARVYGALRTPHFYVFDAQRKLRYTGRMDDNPREPEKAKTHELRDALDALLAGKQPAVAATNPIGCNVKWKDHEEHWMPAEACDLV